MRGQATIRIRFISGVVVLLSCILIGRLYHVQVMRSEAYLEAGEAQYVHTVKDLFSRGSVYMLTKDGEKVSAATIKSGYVLAINPTRVTDPEAVFVALSALLTLDHDSFIEKITDKDRTYQEIDREVDDEVAKKIEELDLPGVQLYRTQWRYYPGGNLSARTIGFVGYEGEKLVGKYGLERYYEDVLARKTDRLSVNFFAEIFGNLGNIVFEAPPEKRGHIVTTIEPTVARTLDHTLETIQSTYQSRLTGGIIMNPKTGEIIALGAVPTFDLNDRSGVEINEFRNPLIEDVYELGSIIKPLTVAAGLDAGAITPESTYYDAGYIDLNDFTIKNYDGKGRGYVSMQEVLSQSLNTGVAHIVTTMGKEKFRDYFLKLKLGTETGIDLPNEAYGLVKNLQSPRDVEYATASFGQGIAFTPIAAARALATLGGGGVLTTPHMVKRIEYDDGTIKEVGFPEGERVYSEKTSEDITRMLVTVVDKALRGGKLSMEHYTIAAKTGTAQIADEERGGYYDDRYLHSFFGYFPAYDPEFLIFLYTVEPKNIQYASETLTDPFMELTHFLINYYNIPPDR